MLRNVMLCDTRAWIEEHDGPQTAQLGLVHLHLPHLGHEFGEYPVKDGAHARLVGRATVYV